MSDIPRYDPAIHHRRSIRLKGYDYSQAGAYFITICTHHHECLFGDIVVRDDHVGAGSEPAPTEPAHTSTSEPSPARIQLNAYGKFVEHTWYDLVNHVDGIGLGEFVIMPNHIHGIIIIVGTDHVGAGSEPAPTKHALPEIVRQFKTIRRGASTIIAARAVRLCGSETIGNISSGMKNRITILLPTF